MPGPSSYKAVHKRLYRIFGPAHEHLCADCLGRAEDWAYLQTAGPAETHDPRCGPYSEDLDDYAPMCRPCHAKFDGKTARMAALGARGRASQAQDPEEHLRQLSAAGRLGGQVTGARRYRCVDCGYTSNARWTEHHLRTTNHGGKEECLQSMPV